MEQRIIKMDGDSQGSKQEACFARANKVPSITLQTNKITPTSMGKMLSLSMVKLC